MYSQYISTHDNIYRYTVVYITDALLYTTRYNTITDSKHPELSTTLFFI